MFSLKYLRLILSFKGKRIPKQKKIIDSGVLGIRLAQEYATRFDLLDIDKCMYLADFYIVNVHKEERHLLQLLPYMAPILSQMEYYDNEPFSYTALSYSFKGCLKNGNEIVIKILNKNAIKNFEKSILGLQKAIKIISFFSKKTVKKLDAENIIEKIKKASDHSLDFEHGIKGTNILSSYAKEYNGQMNISRLRFTRPYSYLSSSEMVVTGYVYGTPFTTLIENRRLSYREVLEVIRLQFFYIFVIGTFHKNLHMGNMILSPEGYIYFTDCSNLATLSITEREGLYHIMDHMCKYDYDQVALSILELSSVKIADERKITIFKKRVNRIFKDFKGSNISNMSFTAKLMMALRDGYIGGLRFGENIFPVIRSFLFLEDMVRNVDPKAVVAEDISKILDDIFIQKQENINKEEPIK